MEGLPKPYNVSSYAHIRKLETSLNLAFQNTSPVYKPIFCTGDVCEATHFTLLLCRLEKENIIHKLG